jgi:hypothetical protein
MLLVSPTGDMLVTVGSDEPEGDSVRVNISVILLPEMTRRDTTILVPSIRLSQQQVDSVRLERLRDAPPSRRPSWADEVAALPIPDVLPAFQTFRIGTDRTIWLIVHHDDRDRNILVLDRELQVIARRRMPRGVWLEAASGNHAIVRGMVKQGEGPLFHVRW